MSQLWFTVIAMVFGNAVILLFPHSEAAVKERISTVIDMVIFALFLQFFPHSWYPPFVHF